MCSSKNITRMADTPKSNRRSNKPLMERRRRERINHCLNELKNLVLTAQKKDPTRYSKLEKADILEMTVRHVQDLHRNDSVLSRNATSPSTADATAKYNAGFRKCASEVSRFLSGVNGLPPDLHARVLSHLSSSTNAEFPLVKRSPAAKGDTLASTKFPPRSKKLPHPPPPPPPPPPHHHPRQQHQLQVAGMSVADARLSSGQLQALVVPSWTGVSVSGSPPTNATSPEAAGAPSSPESARGSPSMSSSTEEPGYDILHSSDHIIAIKYLPRPPTAAHSSALSSSSASFSNVKSTHSSTTVCSGRMQVDLQVAPLDLATSHRRYATITTATASPKRHRAITVSVESVSPQLKTDEYATHPRAPASSSSKSQQLQNVTPIIAKGASIPISLREVRHAPYPVHNHQNPHWRPW
ncbi:transcription factor HES-4-like isoform X2 [Macrobrachium rosenbergii]|uniref:transcription factor HES-4-like isoform X2 n=1 Tax=Macrobrachium rosenbergii TaxID=79674 RepID=UPI0034D6C82B